MNAITLNGYRLGSVAVHGAGVAAPFKGAHYDQKSGPGDVVEEVLELVLENANPATISAGYTSVEKYLQAARDYERRGIGRPVYIECVPVSGESSWRSRLVDGWAEVAGGSRAQGSVGLLVHLTRRNYWEGALTGLPLSNSVSNRLVGGVSIYPHDDAHASHDNYVTVLGSDVPGDLPAPVKVTIKNMSGLALHRFYLGLDGDNSHGWFRATYEAEEGTGGVDSASGLYSNGWIRTVSWAEQGEAEVLSWAVSSAQVIAAGGRFYKALMRIHGGTAYTNCWAKLRVKTGAYTIWDGPWVLLPSGTELVELNTLQIPPYLQEVDGLEAITVTLVVKRATAGVHSLALDYLVYLPVDGYRKLVTRGAGLEDDDFLSDDTLLGVVYVTTNPGLAKTDWFGYGSELVLKPGQDARFYVAWMDGLSLHIDRVCTIKADYRARRRNL